MKHSMEDFDAPYVYQLNIEIGTKAKNREAIIAALNAAIDIATPDIAAGFVVGKIKKKIEKDAA